MPGGREALAAQYAVMFVNDGGHVQVLVGIDATYDARVTSSFFLHRSSPVLDSGSGDFTGTGYLDRTVKRQRVRPFLGHMQRRGETSPFGVPGRPTGPGKDNSSGRSMRGSGRRGHFAAPDPPAAGPLPWPGGQRRNWYLHYYYPCAASGPSIDTGQGTLAPFFEPVYRYRNLARNGVHRLAAQQAQDDLFLPIGRPPFHFGGRAGGASSRATRSFHRPRHNLGHLRLLQHVQLRFQKHVLPQNRVQKNRRRFRLITTESASPCSFRCATSRVSIG